MLHMVAPQKHYVKWKPPDTKDYILSDSIYEIIRIGKSTEAEAN